MEKSCDLEDIEKCLQVHSSEKEGFLKHQNPMTQCKLPLNTKPIPPSIEKPTSNSLISWCKGVDFNVKKRRNYIIWRPKVKDARTYRGHVP